MRLKGKEVLCRNVSVGALSSSTSSKALVDAVAGIGTFQVVSRMEFRRNRSMG